VQDPRRRGTREMFSSGGVRMSRVRHSGRPTSFGSDSPAEGGVRNRAYRPDQVWQLDFTEFETTVGGTFDGDRSPTPGPAARRPLHL